MSAEKLDKVYRGLMGGKRFVAFCPPDENSALRTRFVFGELTVGRVIHPDGNPWMAAQVADDANDEAMTVMLGALGIVENLGPVDPNVARYYLGTAVVKSLMNGGGGGQDYGDTGLVEHIGGRRIEDTTAV